MTYEQPRIVLVLSEDEDIITTSWLYNAGTGSGEDEDEKIDF